MRFSPDQSQRRLIDEVEGVLQSAPAGTDARGLLALLGDERLLAVHYPEKYGGRGLRLSDHAVVAERLGLHGLPDEVHLVTLQGVGCTLLTGGTVKQRERWLPDLASGRAFASLLLSEAAAGTDLAAVTTRAEPQGDAYVITGSKSWSLRADWSQIALCSARTRESRDRYDGLTLLLISLDAPGISIEPAPRLVGDPYFTVRFDGVRVGRDAIVGREHAGWALAIRAIGFERAGYRHLASFDTLESGGVTLLRFLMLRHGVIPASRGGKLKTFLQTVALALYVFPLPASLLWSATVVMTLAVLVTVATGVDYLVRALTMRRAREPAPS
jgi:alkylation response protein AidB-like acyl-CoA dehydrogenase